MSLTITVAFGYIVSESYVPLILFMSVLKKTVVLWHGRLPVNNLQDIFMIFNGNEY